MVIYKLVNKINGDFYIGKTIFSIKKRMVGHKAHANHGSHYYVHNAMRKYGYENFYIEEIEKVETEELLNEREIYWIETLKPKYNMHAGGQGGSKKGRPDITGETREQWEKYWYKLGQNPWNKGKTGIGGYKHSKPMSQEKRNRISEVQKSLSSSVVCEHCSISVGPSNYKKSHGQKCFDKDKVWKLTNIQTGEVLVVEHIRNFCKERGLIRRSIQLVLTGKISHHKGWKVELL
jgi:group I intron endonuclease